MKCKSGSLDLAMEQDRCNGVLEAHKELNVKLLQALSHPQLPIASLFNKTMKISCLD